MPSRVLVTMCMRTTWSLEFFSSSGVSVYSHRKLSRHVPPTDDIQSHVITCLCRKRCHWPEYQQPRKGVLCAVSVRHFAVRAPQRDFEQYTVIFTGECWQNFFFPIKSRGTCLLDNPEFRNVADACFGGYSLEAGKVQHDPFYY